VYLSACVVADTPAELMTVTSTVAATEWAGTTQVIEFPLTWNDGEGTPPKSISLTFWKFDPTIVTLPPPAVGPTAGETPVTTAGITGIVNTTFADGLLADVPAGVVTWIDAWPAPCIGNTALIDVGELTVKLAAGVPSIVTAEAFEKLLPVMVTV
jgi:hypothetical protein